MQVGDNVFPQEEVLTALAWRGHVPPEFDYALPRFALKSTARNSNLPSCYDALSRPIASGMTCPRISDYLYIPMYLTI